MKRAVISSMMTFALGVGGGVAANRLCPAGQPLSLAPQPAEAHTVQVPIAAGTDGVADLVDQVKVAVVNIDTEQHRQVSLMPGMPFRMFLDNENGDAAP